MSTVPMYGRRAGDGTRTLTPLATLFTRVARLINDEELPGASVTVHHDGRIVTVSATHCDLPENVIRRWAQALGFVVTEKPYDWEGTAATLFEAGDVADGIFWKLHAIVPIEPRWGEVGRTDQVRNDSPVKVLATLGGAR